MFVYFDKCGVIGFVPPLRGYIALKTRTTTDFIGKLHDFFFI